MPGPGQGKRSQKKKWQENALNLNASIAAVNTVMTALSTTPLNTRMALSAPLPPNDATTTVTPINETVPNANMSTANTTDEMRVNRATATSSPNDLAPDTDSFTYSHKEVWLLLEEAKLDGWQQGFEEGHRTGRKTGQEEGKVDGYEEGYEEGSRKWGEGHKAGYEAGKKMGKEKEEMACKNGRLEGYELSVQHGKDEEQKKWLMEGHSPGLCLSMAAHAHELFRGAVILEEAKLQTEMATQTDVSTQATPATDKTASQTNDAPEHRCAALQTAPLDNEGPTSLKDA
jgi:hypothetical protein